MEINEGTRGCDTAIASSGHEIEDSSTGTTEEASPSESREARSASQSGLPWGFVAVAAGGFFLHSNLEKLGQDGGFIYIIAAVVLGVLSANLQTGR